MNKITIKEKNVKTHKNKAGISCKWAIGILYKKGNVRFVTSLDNSTKTFHYEADKEPMYFPSKEYADNIVFGMMANMYSAVVMEIPDGYIVKNPKEEEEL